LNPSKKSHETNLERIMRTELERRGLNFEQFYPVRSGFILDFAFPVQKLGIECDGEKWHPPNNKKDRFRDWMLKCGGWVILRFREKEIINDISQCVDEIESCLTLARVM
jgi:very-short-patch-repair endonuclease